MTDENAFYMYFSIILFNYFFILNSLLTISSAIENNVLITKNNCQLDLNEQTMTF